MADIRPFRGLRYAADPALAIAPPYDVISAELQQALYERSPHNVIRIEYGTQSASDSDADNRYTRAARDLAAWRAGGVLRVDVAPAIYAYRQEFEWGGRTHARTAWFGAVRLEPWDAGVIKPHEYTLATPKADRMSLLRATRTQISPVYSLFRDAPGADGADPPTGTPIIDCEADGQRHVVSAITDERAIAAFRERIAAASVYIADGHHRYETALAYRDEARTNAAGAKAASWTGHEPENFVLMALTHVHDPGLLVLPTHRIVTVEAPRAPMTRIARNFAIDGLPAGADRIDDALARLRAVEPGATAFVACGLEGQRVHLLTLADRAAVELMMAAGEPEAWKRLDVNVLQYGVLRDVYGIDDAALAAGGAVSYTQDAGEAHAAVASGSASAAFLLNATPVDQVTAVADAAGRMPQKSTYFYPKLPTGLVLRALE